MELDSLYGILRDITSTLAEKDPSFQALPKDMDEGMLLNEAGLDIITLPDVAAELKNRLGGRDLGLNRLMNPSDVNAMSIGSFLKHIQSMLTNRNKQPLVVYVDDEEENLFIFTRKFGKRLNLKTFTDPTEALAFIKAEESVSLVITDEVMPKLSGNQLCDEVHKSKPSMKFVLITGNPNSDEDLMYKSLRKNRFYEFINKPVDFEKRGDEYLNLIQGLLSFDW
jgi:CheY-like chemotaxis protein